MEEAHSDCPPFMLSFQIFNNNVQNYLVDSGVIANAMSLSIAKKINARWSETSTQIIQLD